MLSRAVTSSDLASRARRYYDANTGRFLRYGQGGSAGAIHRSVWAPSVTTEREAFEYADKFVLERIRARYAGVVDVLDLGCGVGASLAYLAARIPMRGTGITISGVQATLARERIAALGLTDKVRILEGSYLDLPADVDTVQAAFSIEAFLHCPDASRYFEQAAAHLVPQGLLLVLDDFRSERAGKAVSARERRVLDEFREGWVTSTLQTPAAVAATAARHGLGLLDNVNLTPYLETGRPRDRLIAAVMTVARHLPLGGEYFKNFLGGNALRQGLTGGLIEYRFLVFEKQ
jgi:SAM-dependent methyltransferase